jgi:hypothetical protein
MPDNTLVIGAVLPILTQSTDLRYRKSSITFDCYSNNKNSIPIYYWYYLIECQAILMTSLSV